MKLQIQKSFKFRKKKWNLHVAALKVSAAETGKFADKRIGGW